MDRWLMPCGICRQFMVEFGVDMEVISTKPDGSFEVFSLRDLLPMAFTPADLIVKEKST